MIRADIELHREDGFELSAALAFDKGVTALYGASGAGKTTILRLIAGLETGGSHDRITITCGATTWQDARQLAPAHQRQMGYVSQNPYLFPHLTVRGNLAYASRRARTQSVDEDAVLKWLDLKPLLDRMPHNLSGGEAQRVAIGRALLSDPHYILMDEPLGSIDEAARQRILPYLDRLHHELDAVMIYVSHSLDEVNYLADYVYVLDQGRVRAEGSIFETSASLAVNIPEGDKSAAVLACRIIQYDTAYGLTELALGDTRLHVATGPLTPGRTCRVRIPARDVSIALSAPDDSSILNILPAVIDGISPDGGPVVLVRLKVADQFILSRITRKSFSHLKLAEGMAVFAQIKGVALLTEHE